MEIWIVIASICGMSTVDQMTHTSKLSPPLLSLSFSRWYRSFFSRMYAFTNFTIQLNDPDNGKEALSSLYAKSLCRLWNVLTTFGWHLRNLPRQWRGLMQVLEKCWNQKRHFKGTWKSLKKEKVLKTRKDVSSDHLFRCSKKDFNLGKKIIKWSKLKY